MFLICVCDRFASKFICTFLDRGALREFRRPRIGIGIGDSTAATVGTWKLIKGKVSQTFEEIKSSKHHSQPIPVIVAEPVALSAVGWTANEADSDSECITINTPVSEEQHNSDSDPDTELLQHDSSSLGSGDVGATAAIPIEPSRLRRGLAHIKSKVKAKQQAAVMNKKELSTSPSGASSALRSSFLRRRNHAEPNPGNSANTEQPTSSQAAEAARQAKESASSSSSAPEVAVTSGKAKRGIVMARKDVEIESGVEVHEDMIPTGNPEGAESQSDSKVPSSRVRIALDLPIERQVSDTDLPPTPHLDSASEKSIFSGSRPQLWASLSTTSSINWRARSVASPVILLVTLVVLLVMPLPDFLRGVLATILSVMAINWSSSYLHYLFENYVLKTHPERTPFQIPNYYSMPICEIPAVEEHKTIKTYAGWLNEINSYDPVTFSVAMTRSVYVRLDGSVLKLSGTNARIPKRRMWNEVPIDRTKVLFTDHRSYDLRDCRIELLPMGLAKKRFFNRKYPIQLIIKSTYSTGYSTPQGTVSSQMDVQSKESRAMLGANSVTPPGSDELEKTIDFGATVLQADLQQLRNTVNPDLGLQEISIPCGDEVRLLLFARCDREKEDWYRRFVAASKGIVHEQELHVPMMRFVEDTDLQAAAAANAVNMIMGQASKTRPKDADEKSLTSMASNNNDDAGSQTPDTQFEDMLEEDDLPDALKDSYEGLIMNADVARNPADYVKFMAAYQQACNQSQIPVCRKVHHHDPKTHRRRKARRAKRQEEELWKGIDQSLFLGPSGSVVWANVILGRCLFSWLHDTALHVKIQEFMQKKLNSIKLPSFMEEVVITNIYLGQSPMLFHRMSQPMLDERGVWLDADVTYEGLAHITVTTKLNLLRVRSKPKASPVLTDTTPGPETPPEMRNIPDDISQDTISNAIYDSDAESSGGSSTEADSPPPGVATEPTGQTEFFQNSPGNARRIFKIVDRIATSNLFQYATELPYVQRAMENMNANITLRVELKGLVARGTLNIPPPPSDRVWLSFRGPPRLWISTKPQVGDKSVDWSIVTNVIESKLCEAVNKYLVYPNMVDFSIPFLAHPSYENDPPTGGTIN